MAARLATGKLGVLPVTEDDNADSAGASASMLTKGRMEALARTFQ